MRIYLANALGFQSEFDPLLSKYKTALAEVDEVYEPFAACAHLFDPKAIYEKNCEMLRDCDVVVALLDGSGSDTDSGVAWEMGYARALSKPIFGLHSEKLRKQEFGLTLNLQVSFGLAGLFKDLRELKEALAAKSAAEEEAASSGKQRAQTSLLDDAARPVSNA